MSKKYALQSKYQTYEIERDGWLGTRTGNPYDLQQALYEMNLWGRKIIRIEYFGFDYSDSLEERKGKTNRNSYLQLDEPIVIFFEDGDQLEIEGWQYGDYDVILNRCHYDFKSKEDGCESGTKVLAPCINSAIKSITVNEYDELPMDEEWIKNITFGFENGVNLVIQVWVDFFDVFCCDENREVIMVDSMAIPKNEAGK